MTTSVPCPHCGAIVKVSPEIAGKRFACSRCRHEIRPHDIAAPEPTVLDLPPVEPAALFSALATAPRTITREKKRRPSPLSRIWSFAAARPVRSGLVAFGALFVVVATISVVRLVNATNDAMADGTASFRTPEQRVLEFAKDETTSRLKVPSSTRFFDPLSVKRTTLKGIETTRISGRLSSQNAFGTMLESTFSAEVARRLDDDSLELRSIWLGDEPLYLEPETAAALQVFADAAGNEFQGSAEQQRKWAAIQQLAADAIERKLGPVRPLWPNDPTRHEWRVQLLNEKTLWRVTGRAIVQRSGQNKEILVEIDAATGRVETLEIEGIVRK